MFGTSRVSRVEAWRFREVVTSAEGERAGWFQRFVVPAFRFVGGLLFGAAFGWTFGSWLFYEVAFAQALTEGIVIYLLAVLCLTFDDIWTRATAALFLMYEALWKRSRPFAALTGEGKSTTWEKDSWLTGQGDQGAITSDPQIGAIKREIAEILQILRDLLSAEGVGDAT